MEQIIGIIFTLVLGSIISAILEKNKKKTDKKEYEPDDFTLPEANIPDVSVPPLPSSFNQQITLPEEGERVTADVPDDEHEVIKMDEATAAHRERWRRAIIDSEVLNRKF